jgi:putative transcriptional regulator
MIRFRIQELIAEKHFHEGKRVTLLDLSQATGISRVTLSKMVNQIGYSTVTDNLDKLCSFFNCKLSDLAEYVPDDKASIETPEQTQP